MSEVDRMVSSKHAELITTGLHNKNNNKDHSGVLFTAPTIEEMCRKYVAIQNNNTCRGNKIPRVSHDSVNHEATTGELDSHDATISNNNFDEQRNMPRPKMNNKKRQAAAYNSITREGLEIDRNLDAPPHLANITKVATFWTNHMLASNAPKQGRPTKSASKTITEKWETYRERIINGNNVTNTMLTALYNSQDKVMCITSGPTMVRDHGGVRWNQNDWI